MVTRQSHRRQGGAALLIFALLLVMGALTYFLSNLSPELLRAQKTSDALAQAREALVGYALTYRDVRDANDVPGFLPCPDTAAKGGIVYQPGDGLAAGNSHCGSSTDYAIGLLPYRTLGLPDLRDSDGNCLWYAVSNTFKNNQNAPPLNWDTQGQLTARSSDDALLAAPDDANGGAAALIIAPGAALVGRTPINQPCTVDPALIATFIENNGSIFKNGIVKDVNGNIIGNDRLAWITPKEIFDRVVKHAGFSNALAATPPGQINKLADEIKVVIEKQMQDDIVAGGTPASSLPANTASYTQFGKKIGDPSAALSVNDTTYASYFTNWREQFRQVMCSSLDAACLALNNGATANCRGALMFGGRTTTGQPRPSTQKPPQPPPTDESWTGYLGNYFEGSGLAILNTGATSFSGNAAYAAASPSADVGTCLFPGTFVSFARDIAAFAAGTVTPTGGGDAVATVTTSGTPAINLGSGTANARSACVWYPTAIPLDSVLRLYFKFNIGSTSGDTARGFTLALADAATNNPSNTTPPMCGSESASRLGYAGSPVSLFATVGVSSRGISAVSWSGGVATVTTDTAHGFPDGSLVTISGTYPAGYNITNAIISVLSSTRFSYAVADPGPLVAGIAPPKIGLEFDTNVDAFRNDPNTEHFAFDFWGTAADNNPASSSTTNDGSDDVTHDNGAQTRGRTGDGGQPLNPANLSITSATATPVAIVAAARWDSGTTTATITTSAPHGFNTNDSVAITDVTALGYKGTRTVTKIDATHFTYALASDPGTYPYATTVAAAAWAGGTATATVTTSAAHGLATGQTVTLSNISPTAWNGTYVITITDTTHFTYALAANPGTYSSGGQVSAPLATVAGAAWAGGMVTMATAAAHGLAPTSTWRF